MRKLFFLLLILIILIPSAVAVNIGASPGTITFNSLARGGYAEREIVITTNSESNLTGRIDFGGEISSWLRLENNATVFTFSREHPLHARLVIEPPLDAQARSYSGLISFITDTTTSVSGTTGSAVRASVAIRLGAIVIGDEFVSCTVGGMTLPDTERLRLLEFSATLLNNGNVRITPTLSLTVWDQLQREVLFSRSLNSPLILPTTQRSFTNTLEQNLPLGQYWLEVLIPECETTNMLTFNVVEPGTIADAGLLDGVYVRPFNLVNEPVEITAVFTNRGPRTVTARFSGQLTKDGTLISPLESDELVVPAGSQENFRMFYTPSETGTFSVTGRAIYNGKLSFERGATFDVVSDAESGFSFSWVLVLGYFLILGIIIFFIILIRKELRKRHERG